MTSHELARQLLDHPDLPIELFVYSPNDGWSADVGDCKVKIDDIDTESASARGYDIKPGKCIRLSGWMSSEPDENDLDEDDEN